MQRRDFLVNFSGVLRLGLQLQILGVGFLGVLRVLAFLFRFAQAQPGFRQVGVPARGFAKTASRGLIAVLPEILRAHQHFFVGLQRIERVFLHLEVFVLFRGSLHLRLRRGSFGLVFWGRL